MPSLRPQQIQPPAGAGGTSSDFWLFPWGRGPREIGRLGCRSSLPNASEWTARNLQRARYGRHTPPPPTFSRSSAERGAGLRWWAGRPGKTPGTRRRPPGVLERPRGGCGVRGTGDAFPAPGALRFVPRRSRSVGPWEFAPIHGASVSSSAEQSVRSGAGAGEALAEGVPPARPSPLFLMCVLSEATASAQSPAGAHLISPAGASSPYMTQNVEQLATDQRVRLSLAVSISEFSSPVAPPVSLVPILELCLPLPAHRPSPRTQAAQWKWRCGGQSISLCL